MTSHSSSAKRLLLLLLFLASPTNDIYSADGSAAPACWLRHFKRTKCNAPSTRNFTGPGWPWPL